MSPVPALASNANWAPTQSHAILLKTVTAAPAAAGHAASTISGYVVNKHGQPKVQAAVSPLDNAKVLNLAVSLNLRNTAQLQAFVKAVNTPGTAVFGKFLTPDQFKAAYAPTDAQVQAVVAHLQQSGMTHISVSPNNTLVYADGNASAIAAAFNTTMKSYVDNGRLNFANDSDVMVPQALGGIVGSVVGLQNIEHKHPMSYLGRPVVEAANVHGQATTQAAVSHVPTEFPSLYDVGNTPAAFNTTVGIITWGDLVYTVQDLNAMASAAAMNPVNTKVVQVPFGSAVHFSDDPNADMEWNLDSQTIVGTSGGVKQLVFYVAANGLPGTGDGELTDAGITAAYDKAVTDDIAKIINVSLGEDEAIANQSGTQLADDNVFVQAVAQGQTFSVSSGDQGVYVATNGDFETNAGAALPAPFSLSNYSVSEPATSPNVIALGGTELLTNGNAWAGEVTWNDGSQDAGDGNNRLWASTGGSSLFETAPAWQTSTLNATKRQVPDIAFDASTVSGAQILIAGQRYVVGGTSLASPIFVGVFARVQTYANNSIGFPASLMYRDFPTHSAALHDVTQGNNGVTFGGTTYGYNAAAGWDFTTGFGSLDISQFNALAYTWGDGSAPTTNPPPAAPVKLTNGVSVITQGQAGSSQQFTLVVPGGVGNLTFRTSGGSGDISLYVKRGSAASATSYDYASVHPNTNTEAVTVRSPPAGVYYVTVTSPNIFMGVSVSAAYK